MKLSARGDIAKQGAALPGRRERRLLPLFLSALGLSLALPQPAARAASRFTLLSMDGLHQAAGLSYNYQESVSSYQSGKFRSTNHGFSESYSIGAGYSILHPRLLRGNANISLVADQELADESDLGGSSGGNQRVSYNIQGMVLDRAPFPLNFSVDSAQQTIRPPFSRSYTVDSNSWNVTWNLKNELLPATIFVGNTSSTSSGLTNDVASDTQTVQVALNHQAGELSNTRLNLNMDSYRQTLLKTGTRDDHNEAGIEFSNALSWSDSRDLKRKLNTRYLYRERNGGSPGSQGALDSTLDWQIGKTLDGYLRYSRNRNEDPVRSNLLQSVSTLFSQRYLKCLQTTLGGSFTRGSYQDGSDQSVSGSAGVSYTKELPREGRATVNYGYQYGVQERQRSAVDLAVLTTLRPGANFPQFVDLADQNITGSSIQLFLDAGRTLPFTDFSVAFSGTSTRLLLNSDPGVPVLYLSYSYRQSPDITFATQAHSVGGQLALLNGQWLLHAVYSWSNMHLLAGSDPSATLGPSSHLRIGVEGNLDPHTFSLSHSADTSVSQVIRNVEAKWNHTLQVRDASLTSRAEERYSWFANSMAGTGDTQGWDNSFLCSTSYNRTLWRNFRGKLELGYLNLTTDGTSSNKVNLEIYLEGNYGKTQVSLITAGNVSFSSLGYAHNQSVTLNVRRVF